MRSNVTHGSNIMSHIQLMQDITDYVNLAKAIFHNNVLYREIAHS